jgi:DNA-directed RNA polymerase specialized sigma24 family protein
MQTAAFYQMVITYRKSLFETVARLTGEPTAVERLVQDVFATAYYTLKDQRDLERNLLRITVEKCMQQMRGTPQSDRLSVLKPELRVLVVLHDLEQRSAEDVCFICGISREALASRLSAAYRCLLPKAPSPWFESTPLLGWKR